MKNLLVISNELMENIASYMDDDLREVTHFAVAPCSNEVFITEYYNTASAELKRALEDILSDEFNLDLDDIIYSAYYQVYNNLSISQEELNELQADCNTLVIKPVNSVVAHRDEKPYLIIMISGDLIVFCEEEHKMNEYVVYYREANSTQIFETSVTADSFKEALEFVREDLYERYEIIDIRKVDK